jgi:hypothetical protein
VSDLAVQTPAPAVLRPSVGLLLSIGEPPNDGRNYPKKLDHFRAKPGQLDQYRMAADRFHEIYGPEPKSIDDVYFLSNQLGDVLDVRRKVWGQSGLKAMSLTNFATYPPETFRERVDAWDDELITFPDDKQDPGRYQLQGPDDPVIAKAKMKVYATLRVCLPKVLGMGMVVEITTTGRRSTDNLYASLQYALGFTRGNLIGVPFRLSVRPARMRYWDAKEGKRKATEFFELVLDTPLTLSEMAEVIREQRLAMEAPVAQAALPAPAAEATPEFFADNDDRRIEAALDAVQPPADDDGPDDAPEVIDESVTEVLSEEETQSLFESMVPADVRGGSGR